MEVATTNEEYVEDVVCQVQDLGENEMKTFDLGDHKVLLVKQKGNISALGTKCTHYGAPLVNGALGDGRIRCQWHGACFSLRTGDIEDFPGLDSLPCYRVTVEGDNVKVRAKRDELEANKRVKAMIGKSPSVREKIVIIGGGPAGATCVETLRQEGFQGEIVLICKENCLPYDRIKLSKAMDIEIAKLEFRNDKFYQDNGITVLKGVSATAVDTKAKSVSLNDGKSLNYDRLLIATGSRARKLDLPGSDLKNVFTLREFEDCRKILAQIGKDKEVVILGSSFIGMEAANYCVDKVKKVTVIGRDSVPFRPVWGERIGGAILKLYESKGVHFIGKSGIQKIVGNCQGVISNVELINGQTIKADVLIMGVGVLLNTDFLKSSGITLKPDNSIETDEYLQTNVGDVYAGGDVAYAPVWCDDNAKSVIGHFGLAHYHGRTAALNMLGKRQSLRNVPFFWAMLFGKGFRYAGHGKFDDVVYSGDVEGLKFAAFFLRDGVVVSAAACGMDPIVSQFAETMAQGRKLNKSDLIPDPLAWAKTA